MKHSKESGVSLIEVMVTLLIFLLGILGIILYTIGGMKSVSASQGRSSAFKIASQAIEPLVYHPRLDCLSMMLNTFPRTVKGDNDKDTLVINLVKAVDGSGTQIATVSASGVVTTTAYADWKTPVVVTLSVPYTGVDGTTVLSRPSFAVILQDYGGTCDA